MSGYWDAVTRAALDLPAPAGPRPRSLFEPDGMAGASDELESGGEVFEQPRSGVSPAARPETAPPPPAVVEGAARAAATSTGEIRMQAGPPAATRPADAEDAGAVAERHMTALPVEPVAKPSPTVVGRPPAPERIERTEVHLVERTETVREVVAEPRVTVVESRLAPPEGAATLADQFPAPGDRQAAVPAAPSVVVAEPAMPAAPPVDRRAAVEAPPPFVIEIERVDIRIEHEHQAAPVRPGPQPADVGSVPSLNDYLARRGEVRA